MVGKVFVLIFTSATLSALGQIALKSGMSRDSVQRLFQGEASGLDIALAIGMNSRVFLGLFLYGSGALVWLFVLAKVDVSQAYPFMGLGFVLTMVFAYFAFHEPIGLIRVLGTLMVAAGVVLVAHS